MKLDKNAFANASAAVTGIIYIFCAAAVAIFPGISKTIAESWFHGISLETLWTAAPRGNFVLGLLTAVAGVWLIGWLFAWLYNRLVK